jgi:ribonuclease VapC
MFVDASALCAILLNEHDGPVLQAKLAANPGAVTSQIAVFETVRALLRDTEAEFDRARTRVLDFLEAAEIGIIPIAAAEGAAALDATDRFGKGRHPARLNLGDCFAYGCAMANGLPLLFKGDDFSQTDIARA